MIRDVVIMVLAGLGFIASVVATVFTFEGPARWARRLRAKKSGWGR